MILIVEDDEHKSSQIVEVIQSENAQIGIKLVDNVHDAVSYLKGSISDKIILDMSLPSHKALKGQGAPAPLPTGGIEVLFELKKKRKISLPIFILTQYPEIEIEGEPYLISQSAQAFKDEYGFNNITACYYDSVDNNKWQMMLLDFMRS